MPVNPYLNNQTAVPFNPYQNPYYNTAVPIQQTPQQNEMIVVPVQGIENAKQYPVAAGLSVLLMDYNAKKFWVKTTSANGLGSSMDEYDFTPVKDDKKEETHEQYATQEDMKKVMKSIDELRKILDDLTK